VWQTNATFTDPASINTAENNQVTLNVSSAALTPANQIRRYIVGTDSYYVDQSGSVLFTGSNFRVNGSAIFGGTVQVNGLATLNAGLTVTGTVKVNSLTASQAVVTDGSSNLVSLQYTSANTVGTLVQRDGNGDFSARYFDGLAAAADHVISRRGAAFPSDPPSPPNPGLNRIYWDWAQTHSGFLTPYVDVTAPPSIGLWVGNFHCNDITFDGTITGNIEPDHIKSHTGASGSDTNPPTGNKVYWSWDNPHTGYLTPWVDTTPEVSLWTGNIHCNGVYRGHTGSEISNFGAQIETRSTDSLSFDWTSISSPPVCQLTDPFSTTSSMKFLINDSTKFEVIEYLNIPDIDVGCNFLGNYITLKTATLTLNLKMNSPTITKSFIIDHPLDPDRYLVHACIEGPTVDVYYRGEARLSDGAATVTLPSYFEALTKKENRTVTLTCIGGWSKLWVDGEVADGMLTVKGDGSQRFYWEVKAERGSIEVEPKKSDIEVFGDGPYRYYKAR
jgi:hypothetical protein